MVVYHDPTYNQEEINTNPAWQLAFSLSEILNANAPLGWAGYISTAQILMTNYDIKRKEGR